MGLELLAGSEAVNDVEDDQMEQPVKLSSMWRMLDMN